MECFRVFDNGEPQLPLGFRFHPTDEELITYYLLKKVLDSSFTGRAIAEIDINKCEPWELPEKAKMGEKEWYFFSLRDRKYPTGLRTNRATEAGYWKATGKDREVNSSKTCALIGMKKTLVFYRGRAPKGEKSNWIMHEYRLDGKFAYHNISTSSKDEWVISRVFQKTGANNGNSSNKARFNTISPYPEVSCPSSVSLPPLLDATANASTFTPNDRESCSFDSSKPEHVSCFSTMAAAASANQNIFSLTQPLQPPPLADPFARFSGSFGSASAFPSLRLLQENLQHPFDFPSTTGKPFPGMNWVEGAAEGRCGEGGNGILTTEFNCMWNIKYY